MRKWVISLVAVILWPLLSTPVHAADASAFVSLKENDFANKKIVDTVNKRGEKDWEQFPTRKDRKILLDCGHAVYLLGGTDALKTAITAVKRPFFIESQCDDMKRVGIFFEQVKLGQERKQLLMIAPADEDYVKQMGMEKFLQAQIGEDINTNLYDYLSPKLLEKNVKLLKKR